jgi:hypothetical protein
VNITGSQVSTSSLQDCFTADFRFAEELLLLSKVKQTLNPPYPGYQPLFEEKVTVNTIPAPLDLGAPVTVTDSDGWKTGSCIRALPISNSGVEVVRRAAKIVKFYFQ